MPQRCCVALILFVACAGPGRGAGFVAADPTDPDRLAVCTGEITAIEHRVDSDCVIHLAPRRQDARLLAPGQTVMLCAIPSSHRASFDPILARIEVGRRIEVAGYWVKNVVTGHHEIRRVTSIDLFPDTDR